MRRFSNEKRSGRLLQMDFTPHSSKGKEKSRRIAVFARNHPEYLQAAAKDPSKQVTFQSKRRWARVEKALASEEPIKIYFAPNGQDKIKYEATIKDVDLNPRKDSSLLNFRLDETVEEGIWGKTLYMISNCRRVPDLKLSDLQKEDGAPLSDNFKYSYAVVRELPGIVYLPDELPFWPEYPEGAVHQVTVDAYERNPAARVACLKHHGTSCVVCGFNFAGTYGKIGDGFIHVHHLTPLAAIKQGYNVDPIANLRPVCPNCHAMLHRANLSIENLTDLVKAGAQPFKAA
jgi:hypothetical protein